MNRKALIKEAVKLINQYGSVVTDAGGYVNYNHEAVMAFEACGWKFLGHGAYKLAFRKGKVIVKIGNTEGDRDAYRNLRNTGLSRNVAKLYYINTVGMVQQAVKPILSDKEGEKFRNKAMELSDKFGEIGYLLEDVWDNDNNYGTLGGKLKVFDFFLCYKGQRSDDA